jgi:predicted metal-binding membrane protein
MYGGMDGPSAWMMRAHWDLRYGVLIFLMWVVMMVGMMLPSAVPTILQFARAAEGSPQNPTPTVRAYAFGGGYLLVWTAFSLAATLLQWGLAELRLLSPMMETSSPLLAAGILIAAGAYQWTPLKRACLAHCRSPLDPSSHASRSGVVWALRMGVDYGFVCVGCCWVLMLLLFAGGVMSLAVIGAITFFVLLEKMVPFGTLVGRLAGVALAGIGVWILLP